MISSWHLRLTYRQPAQLRFIWVSPTGEEFAKNKHSVQQRGRLYQDRFGKLRGKMIEKDAHGGQQPLPGSAGAR
jgi:hypothetical protein